MFSHRSIKVTLFCEKHIEIFSKIILTYHQIASILLHLTLYYFVVYVNDSCLYYSKSIKQSEVIFMKPLKNKVSITLDSDIIDAIKILAEQDDRSFSQYINMVLKEHLDHSSSCESHNK